jgi:hypothetical protein
MSITTILAIWGALVSSFVLGWSIFRDLSDKGKINVSCFIGNEIGGIRDSNKTILVYTITNVGRRPIYVKIVGGAFTKKHFLITTQNIPKMLNPGEYVVESTEDLSMFDKDLKYLWVIDSLDNYWKVSKKNLKYLFNTYKKEKTT